ncbi:hypothetical protein [Ornithinimicrobium kibberense]|uniref:hypothetical protein n=1 Tax=Ornithinimicrobium kibberense TaxID=282060 RepID=UPI0036146E4C
MCSPAMIRAPTTWWPRRSEPGGDATRDPVREATGDVVKTRVSSQVRRWGRGSRDVSGDVSRDVVGTCVPRWWRPGC